jgi:hypothetical protein
MGAPWMPQWMFWVEGRPVGAAGPTVPMRGSVPEGSAKEVLKTAVLMGVTVVAMTRDVDRVGMEGVGSEISGSESVGREKVGREKVGREKVGSGRVLNCMLLRLLVVRFSSGSGRVAVRFGRPVGRSAVMFRDGKTVGSVRLGRGRSVTGSPGRDDRLRVGNGPPVTLPVKRGRVRFTGRLVTFSSGMTKGALSVALGASGWPT